MNFKKASLKKMNQKYWHPNNIFRLMQNYLKFSSK